VSASRGRACVYLGLGANLGDRRASLGQALHALAGVVDIDALSSIYETEPVGDPDQPDYLNMVVRARTDLEPRALLDRVLDVERSMGRRRGPRNAARIIDVDVLLYDELALRDEGLELPHPRLTERAFVLAPLVELDPTLVHPLSHERLADLLARGGFERVMVVGRGEELIRTGRETHA